MKILVTGGLGFIGSNFILNVFNKYTKIDITNVDARLLGSNPQNLKCLKDHKKYSFTKADINNKKIMEKLIQKNDIIVNFAAETHVDRSIENSSSFLKSNLLGVQNILELVRKNKKRLIHVSTDEVFGSIKSGSATENSSLRPGNPYSASKAAAELLIHSFINTYDCDVNITRCTNNYGPRQSPEKLIPKVILYAEKNEKIPIYGTGKNIRDWIYVTDHCDAIMKVLLDGKKGESYNISNLNEIKNMVIVKKILRLMNKSYDLLEFVSDRPGHDFRYSMESNKIRKQLRWRPKYDLESGLRETIKWYLLNKKWRKNLPASTWKEYWK